MQNGQAIVVLGLLIGVGTTAVGMGTIFQDWFREMMFFFLVTSSFRFLSFLSGFKTGELAAVSHSENAIEEFFNPPRFNGLEEHSSALLIV